MFFLVFNANKRSVSIDLKNPITPRAAASGCRAAPCVSPTHRR
jgi:hypothetical protein